MVKIATKKNSKLKQVYSEDEALDIGYRKSPDNSDSVDSETHWSEEEHFLPLVQLGLRADRTILRPRHHRDRAAQ